MTELVTPQREVELPRPNLPLLRKVLDHIDAHPESHNQGNWGEEGSAKCGTPMCIAGWAVELSDMWGGCPGLSGNVATDLLGITTDEARDLFLETITPDVFGLDSDDVRGAIQIVAQRIAARAGEVL